MREREREREREGAGVSTFPGQCNQSQLGEEEWLRVGVAVVREF